MMIRVQSDPIIDTMRDSACCLSCRTLQDPFVGCSCKAEEFFASMSATHGSIGQVQTLSVLNGNTAQDVPFKWATDAISTEKRDAIKQEAEALFVAGKYKECIEFVDSVFGWAPGELGRQSFTKENAEFSLRQL